MSFYRLRNWRAAARHDIASETIELFVSAEKVGDGADCECVEITGLELKNAVPRRAVRQRLHVDDDNGVEDFMQAILDAAWDVGLRPRGFGDTTQEVGAIRNHLEDMRKLALKDKFEPLKR